MKHQVNHKLLKRLDAQEYSNQELIVLAIPLSLPYPIQNEGYERVDGDYLYKGQAYKLVKKKLENDTLFLVCIHDVETTRIASTLLDYIQVVNDLPSQTKQTLSFLDKLYKNFNITEFIPRFKKRLLVEQFYNAGNFYALRNPSYPVDSPPPDLLF